MNKLMTLTTIRILENDFVEKALYQKTVLSRIWANIHSTIEMIASIIGTLWYFEEKLPIIVVPTVPSSPSYKHNLQNDSFLI